MPRKSPPKPDEKPQFERFIEAAKKVGAAQTDEGLPDAIRNMVGSGAATPAAKPRRPP